MKISPSHHNNIPVGLPRSILNPDSLYDLIKQKRYEKNDKHMRTTRGVKQHSRKNHRSQQSSRSNNSSKKSTTESKFKDETAPSDARMPWNPFINFVYVPKKPRKKKTKKITEKKP